MGAATSINQPQITPSTGSRSPSQAPLSSSSLTLTHPQSFEGLLAHSTGRGTFLGSKDIAERWKGGGTE